MSTYCVISNLPCMNHHACPKAGDSNLELELWLALWPMGLLFCFALERPQIEGFADRNHLSHYNLSIKMYLSW